MGLRHERRVRLGRLDVASGRLLVMDPDYLSDWNLEGLYKDVNRLTDSPSGGGELDRSPDGQAKGVTLALGDGMYDVWATVEGPYSLITRIEIEHPGVDVGEEQEDAPWA